MRVYEGRRIDGATRVTVGGELLEPRHDLGNLFPTFEWGFHGSGPDQLALALLADAVGDRTAVDLYHRYRDHYVSKFPTTWRLTDDQIKYGVAKLMAGV